MPKPRSSKSSRKQGTPVVRTTINLPQDLWRQAKILALDERKHLRELIIEGLQLVLAHNKRGK